VTGSFSVWEVNLNGFSANTPTAVRKVASFPAAQILDGMTTLNASPKLVLISDPIDGVVYSLNVNSGAAFVALNLTDMKLVQGDIPFLGVNGMKVETDDTLFYTSSNQHLIIRLPIHADGTAAGAPATISKQTGSGDDFDLDPAGNAFMASNAEALLFINATSGAATLLAGGPKTTTLPGITSGKFADCPPTRRFCTWGPRAALSAI
jgi:hypothetical protein